MAELRDGSPVDVYRFAPAASDEEYVYGACCPGWHSTTEFDVAVEEWVGFMRDQCIERVCCLLSGNPLESSDTAFGRYRAAFGPENVVHVPIVDHHLACVHTLADDVLPFLDDAVASDERVVVHCLAGIGRTGHVLAAWLVHGRDYDPVDAIETVERMGRSPTEAVDAGSVRPGELSELLFEFS